MAAWLAVSPLAAQVERLPPVMPPSEVEPAWVEDGPVFEPAVVLPAPEPPLNPDRPLDARDGFFQKLIFDSTWITPFGDDSLEVRSLELRTVLALPVPSRQWPLVLKPGFGVHFLNGLDTPDVPSQVYDSYIQFRWFRRLSPQWLIDLSVTPGVYSDFDQSNDDALRITGHAVAMFTWSPALKFVGGVAYLNREDYRILPAAGLIWTPTEDVKLELLFPKPELAWRLRAIGPPTDAIEDWIYLAAEFGGGRWAVTRASGAEDVLFYSDVRILLGLEHKQIRGIDSRVEIGYVFAREIEYERQNREYDLSDGILLRAGFTY